MELEYIIKKEDEYTEIKQVLFQEFNISARLYTTIKKKNLLFLNQAPAKPYDRVHVGDYILVDLNHSEESNIIPTLMKLDILEETPGYLVLHKPAGIAIHPSCRHFDSSLSNGVQFYFNKIGLQKKIRPVNRLDKDTSGVVIFAKNEFIQECLIKQMKAGVFKKKYIAILDGILSEEKGTICKAIARKEGSIIEREINADGDTAITHYLVLRTKINLSLVEFVIETGKTHQIRIHSQYLGAPILGDTLYGNSSSLISRQALHSYEIQFQDPITKELKTYTAPIPQDMEKIIETM